MAKGYPIEHGGPATVGALTCPSELAILYSMKTPAWLIPLFIFGACGFVLTLWMQRLGPTEKQPLLPADNQLPSAEDQRRDFNLTDTNGQRVTLATYQGKFVLMFFGFTNCPDACPTAMLNVGATLREMGSAVRQIQPVFVTLDPERDTPALLQDYLKNFGDNIVGLSGTPDETADIAKRYGVYYRKRQIEGGDYTLDHSTALYLISPGGKYMRPFTSDIHPAAFAATLTASISNASEEKP
jgi:protein SCO1/2